jgi:hypothetical protein
MSDKLKRLLEEYGRVAIATYFSIFALTFLGFLTAISAGVQVESVQGNVGLFGAAYVATKLSQPLRIAGTVALTPLIATALKRFRRREQPPPT